MEPNEDIAAPDIDTVRIPAAPATPAPDSATTPTSEPVALEDADTARVASVAASAPNSTDDLAAVDTVRVPVTTVELRDPATEDTARIPAVAVRVDDPATVDTVRVPAAVVSKQPTEDTVADAPTARVPIAATARRERVVRYVWLRYPEFWLIIVLAAFLRLFRIDLTSFVFDQTELLRLARGAWVYHVLPVTGIPSSIGTLNSPLSVYLLMPFTLFTKDPLPAVISIALWNVVGVALCYIFAQRHFGRIIAASSALLFASCASAVSLSRFIWQQNYLPPVLALWILTLYAGCVSGRRRWFVPHVALLTIAVQLHPTTALLIPVSLVGLILTPRQAMPSRREWPIAAAVVLLLLAPTLLWEAISRGSDLRMFAHYVGRHGSFNLDIFHMVYQILGGPWLGEFGPQALYAQLDPWATVINIVAVLFFLAGMGVLTERLVRVGVYIWREGGAKATDRASGIRRGALAVWHGLRAEPVWRAHLLLWLWIVLPIVVLVRHSSPLIAPYLLLLYPAVFIAGGFAVQASYRLAGRLMSRAVFPRRLVRGGILVVLALLVLAQAFQATLFPATLASGSFNAFVSYGYPLAEAQQLNAALTTLQAEQDARTMFISMPENTRYQYPLDYLSVSEYPNRVGFAANCLVLPAPDQQPALLVATQPAGPANAMLTSLPELTSVANLAMAGSDAVAVYQMNGTLPALLGERTLTPITFADATGSGLRLDAVAVQPDGLIRMRWTVLGSATKGDGTPWYRVVPSVQTASGDTHALPYTDCQPTRWHAGETVFTWANAGATGAQALILQVRGSIHVTVLNTGRVTVLAGGAYNTALSPLTPSAGATSTDGAVTIPLTNTP